MNIFAQMNTIARIRKRMRPYVELGEGSWGRDAVSHGELGASVYEHVYDGARISLCEFGVALESTLGLIRLRYEDILEVRGLTPVQLNAVKEEVRAARTQVAHTMTIVTAGSQVEHALPGPVFLTLASHLQGLAADARYYVALDRSKRIP